MTSEEKSKPWVEYNWLGPNCGIKVSNICLGTMTFGQPTKGHVLPSNTDSAQSGVLLDRYYELGGNFVDTANVYSQGLSEQIIGEWKNKLDRSQLVLATKVRFTPSFGSEPNLPNSCGLSRGAILTNLESSLRRLQTDYIDLYYAHAWDSGVKLEETLRTFNDVVRSGKVRYVAYSNVTGAQLQQITDYNKFLGFDHCVALQQEYNLLERHNEIEVVPTCRTAGVALIPYGSLKGGLLTGKFKRNDHEINKTLPGSRLAWTAEKPKERSFSVAPYVENYRENENYWTLMEATADIAKAHGKTQSQVAVRWVLQKDVVSSVIIGAKTIQQLEDNMGAGSGWSLTEEEMKRLDEVSSFAAPAQTYPYTLINMFNADRIRQF